MENMEAVIEKRLSIMGQRHKRDGVNKKIIHLAWNNRTKVGKGVDRCGGHPSMPEHIHLIPAAPEGHF